MAKVDSHAIAGGVTLKDGEMVGGEGSYSMIKHQPEIPSLLSVPTEKKILEEKTVTDNKKLKPVGLDDCGSGSA